MAAVHTQPERASTLLAAPTPSRDDSDPRGRGGLTPLSLLHLGLIPPWTREGGDLVLGQEQGLCPPVLGHTWVSAPVSSGLPTPAPQRATVGSDLYLAGGRAEDTRQHVCRAGSQPGLSRRLASPGSLPLIEGYRGRGRDQALLPVASGPWAAGAMSLLVI